MTIEYREKQDFSQDPVPQLPIRLAPDKLTKVADPRCTLIRVRLGDDYGPRLVDYATTDEAKIRMLLTEHHPGDILLLAWPGAFRQDVFLLHPDDLDNVRRAMGLQLEEELIDRDGRKWVRREQAPVGVLHQRCCQEW